MRKIHVLEKEKQQKWRVGSFQEWAGILPYNYHTRRVIKHYNLNVLIFRLTQKKATSPSLASIER